MPEESLLSGGDGVKVPGGRPKAKTVLVLYGQRRPSKRRIGRWTKALGAECVAVKADTVKSLASLPTGKSAAVLFIDRKAVERFVAGVSPQGPGTREPKSAGRGELEQIAALRNDFGVSYETLSRILHVSHRTVLRWLHGESAPQPGHVDAIEKIVHLRNRMLKVLRKEAIPRYLKAYSDVLGGVRPLDLLISGQAHKVASDIAGLESGAFV